MIDFLEHVKSIIDEDVEITPSTVFRELKNWDSVMTIEFLAMVEDVYHKELRMEDINKSETFQDLYDIVVKK